MSKHKNLKKLLIIIIVTAVLVAIYVFLQNHRVFTGREFRQVRRYIGSYGTVAPIVIVILMTLSTLIPPLPLPIPLIEVTSGVIFGFLEGAIIVWLGQVISSFMAFATVRFFNKTFIGKFLKNKRWNFYETYLKERGTKAILITRATLSSPFNIISFMAGLSSMPWKAFLWSTSIGVIPETILYTFIGSQLRELHIRFIWLSSIILAISLAGFGITFITTSFLKPKLATKEK
jgi:uncharacterized membrane protein YdjX (TVP38/TMEM64 family)